MSERFRNEKGISDVRESNGICDKDGKTNEKIQRGDQVKKFFIEFD